MHPVRFEHNPYRAPTVTGPASAAHSPDRMTRMPGARGARRVRRGDPAESRPTRAARHAHATEGEGFELSNDVAAVSGLATAAFNRSATPPRVCSQCRPLKASRAGWVG
jgi:hypothetical protein